MISGYNWFSLERKWKLNAAHLYIPVQGEARVWGSQFWRSASHSCCQAAHGDADQIVSTVEKKTKSTPVLYTPLSRNIIKYVIKSKAIHGQETPQMGYKVWAGWQRRTDTDNFELYAGKDDKVNRTVEPVATCLLVLYHQTTITSCIFDNYFNSPHLQIHLASKGILSSAEYAVGGGTAPLQRLLHENTSRTYTVKSIGFKTPVIVHSNYCLWCFGANGVSRHYWWW